VSFTVQFLDCKRLIQTANKSDPCQNINSQIIIIIYFFFGGDFLPFFFFLYFFETSSKKDLMKTFFRLTRGMSLAHRMLPFKGGAS